MGVYYDTIYAYKHTPLILGLHYIQPPGNCILGSFVEPALVDCRMAAASISSFDVPPAGDTGVRREVALADRAGRRSGLTISTNNGSISGMACKVGALGALRFRRRLASSMGIGGSSLSAARAVNVDTDRCGFGGRQDGFSDAKEGTSDTLDACE